MYCPVCSDILKLKEIIDHKDHAVVTRVCINCFRIWKLEYGNDVVVIRLVGEMTEVGFDYQCPHCKFSGHVYTVYYPDRGWSCLKCKTHIPITCIKPTGGYVIPKNTRAFTSTFNRHTSSPSTYQRKTPRPTSFPPVGVVSLSSLAGELNVEPKKLRAWLRRSEWRSKGDSGSKWLFSQDEAKEISAHYQGR